MAKGPGGAGDPRPRGAVQRGGDGRGDGVLRQGHGLGGGAGALREDGREAIRPGPKRFSVIFEEFQWFHMVLKVISVFFMVFHGFQGSKSRISSSKE